VEEFSSLEVWHKTVAGVRDKLESNGATLARSRDGRLWGLPGRSETEMLPPIKRGLIAAGARFPHQLLGFQFAGGQVLALCFCAISASGLFVFSVRRLARFRLAMLHQLLRHADKVVQLADLGCERCAALLRHLNDISHRNPSSTHESLRRDEALRAFFRGECVHTAYCASICLKHNIDVMRNLK